MQSDSLLNREIKFKSYHKFNTISQNKIITISTYNNLIDSHQEIIIFSSHLTN